MHYVILFSGFFRVETLTRQDYTEMIRDGESIMMQCYDSDICKRLGIEIGESIDLCFFGNWNDIK